MKMGGEPWGGQLEELSTPLRQGGRLSPLGMGVRGKGLEVKTHLSNDFQAHQVSFARRQA